MISMQQVYIPQERIRKLRGSRTQVPRIERLCGCKIKLLDDCAVIEGDAFAEYTARNIIYAIGRGFEIDAACLLANDDYYFSSIDIEQSARNQKRMKQLKARIIGENGRSKRYIEEVSSAKVSVYGDTVSFIGTIEGINEAETAVSTLVDGGTHRLAYSRMEAAHRKNREARKRP